MDLLVLAWFRTPTAKLLFYLYSNMPIIMHLLLPVAYFN